LAYAYRTEGRDLASLKQLLAAILTYPLVGLTLRPEAEAGPWLLWGVVKPYLICLWCSGKAVCEFCGDLWRNASCVGL